MAGLLLSANASAQTAQPAEQTAPTTAGPSVAGPSVASPSVANPPATSPDKAKTPDKTKTPASKTAPPKTAPPKTAPPKTAPPKTATPTATTKLLKAPPAPTGADASKAPAATAPLVLPAPVAIPDQPDLPTHKPAVPGAGVKFGQITAPTTPGIKPLAVPAPAEAVPDYVAPPPLAEQHNPAPAWTGEKPTQDRKTLAVAAKASDSVQLLFAAGSKDMPADLQERLSGLAARLEAQPAERLRISAYASGLPDQPVEARRLALQRGSAIRDAMIGLGIRSGRIDVRALGEDADGGPGDRVDVMLDSAARADDKAPD